MSGGPQEQGEYDRPFLQTEETYTALADLGEIRPALSYKTSPEFPGVLKISVEDLSLLLWS